MPDTTASRRNGQTPPADPFPVDSFRDAARHLRRPFTPAAVKFKVQATWPKENPTGGLIVAYIDARLAVERLNLIVPHLWHDQYEPLGNKHLICRLTVDGITRQDIGEGTGKGLYSDALKRAAVKFGIGVSLYAIPQMRLNTSSATVEPRRTKDGMSLALTPKGEQLLRSMYEQWLDAHGRQAFGEPLDHGDVEGAQGDADDHIPADVDPATGEIAESAEGRVSAEPPKATEKVATARQRGLINAKAGEKQLPPAALANVLLAAAEQQPREFSGDESAQRFIARNLDRLPARLVDPILERIAAVEAEPVPA